MPRVKPTLTHLDQHGAMHMVDVSAKAATSRVAVARATVKMSKTTMALLKAQHTRKGDVLAAARLAGIGAAKKTWDLIPLCHPIALNHVSIDIAWHDSTTVIIEARTQTIASTGVEMEAMVAASVAALTLYDMLKATERGIRIEGIELVEKRGGKSSTWQRSKPLAPAKARSRQVSK